MAIRVVVERYSE